MTTTAQECRPASKKNFLMRCVTSKSAVQGCVQSVKRNGRAISHAMNGEDGGWCIHDPVHPRELPKIAGAESSLSAQPGRLAPKSSISFANTRRRWSPFARAKRRPASADDLMLAWRESARDFEPRTIVGSKLRRAAFDFLDSNLALQAIETGWRERELFGVLDHFDVDVIGRRADAKGVVSSVALTPWEGTYLEGFAISHAVIVTGFGAIFPAA